MSNSCQRLHKQYLPNNQKQSINSIPFITMLLLLAPAALLTTQVKVPPREVVTCRTLSNWAPGASLSTWKLCPLLDDNGDPLWSQATLVGGNNDEGQVRENKAGDPSTASVTSSSNLGIPGAKYSTSSSDYLK